MWLLSTHTAELKFFSSPDKVPGGYAILSHVWGNPACDEDGIRIEKSPDEEETFQNVRSAFEESQEKSRTFEDISPPPVSSDNAPIKPISPLSAQVKGLSAQVVLCTWKMRAG